MGFTETLFLFLFMPVSVIIYLLIEKLFHKDKINNTILVVLSLIFYYWASKESMFIFLAIAVFTYMAGWVVKPENNGEKGKRVVFPLVCCIGMLAYYKYAVLISDWINLLTGQETVTLGEFIVPIGLSFVVFESISYVIDIYRGDSEPGSLLECLTFLSLFPKLVSGPIVLWKDFGPQLKDRRTNLDDIAAGIDRIIVGYAKKAIIADTFGAQILLINNGIAAGNADIPTMWLKAILYFFQIYFDFSGYSDIAIGLCHIFGFKVKDNFNYPYLSRSITEFWRRWHISLGTWFREYVYIPLGGNRKGNVYVHLLIVFILTGMWHGSTLPFLVWGGWNAVWVMLERAMQKRNWYKKIPSVVKWIVTIFCVLFGWIMFSSGTLEEAFSSYTYMFVPMTTEIVDLTWQYYLSNRILLFLSIAILGHVFGTERIHKAIQDIFSINVWGTVKKVFLLLLFVIDILYVVNSTYSPFIYFQF